MNGVPPFLAFRGQAQQPTTTRRGIQPHCRYFRRKLELIFAMLTRLAAQIKFVNTLYQ
jgi:hypothetical protein